METIPMCLGTIKLW